MKVAIVGRPNVGKSTLFNRLVGKKVALVDDLPGLTRDWRLMPARLGDLEFKLFDTAGLLGFEEHDLKTQIALQTQKVMGQADVILVLVDGVAGPLPADKELVQALQREKYPNILLVANKCENTKTVQSLSEFYKLGMGEPLAISAEHGLGLGELYDFLKVISDGLEPQEVIDPEAPEDRTMQLSIVGRPNAGKSTLINRLLGEERLLTGDKPGVTRDSIHIDWSYGGRSIRLVDTAGMRRKARIDERLERISVGDAMRSIRFSDVVVLVVDATMPLEKQDLTIAEHVVEEGRALVIAVNKADLQKGEYLKEIHHRLGYVLPQIKGVPCIPISAKNGKNIDKLMASVFEMEALWNTRIGTSVLNQWLFETIERHPPPIAGGKRIRLKYMTQIKTRPPTFVLFISKPAKLLESYLRYLLNKLRNDFDLKGVPIRFEMRKGSNPYEDKK
jgi:GTP-binding protein